MSTLFLLSTILFVCMVLIGGQKGVKSFLSLFINFIVIFFSIFFVARSRLNISYLVLLYEIVMKFVIYMIK